MAAPGVKFIRVHGRVVPVRDKSGADAGAKTRAPKRRAGKRPPEEDEIDLKVDAYEREEFKKKNRRASTVGERAGAAAFFGTIGAGTGALVAGRLGAVVGGAVGASFGIRRSKTRLTEAGRRRAEQAGTRALQNYRRARSR